MLEAAEAWGGCVGRHDVAGLTLDSGAESFATRSAAVADLAAELGLGGKHRCAPSPAARGCSCPTAPANFPRPVCWASRRTRGTRRCAARSAWAVPCAPRLDKLLPASVGTTAEVTSVSALVRTRMGRRVLERLVEPVVGGVHSADPGLLDVDMVAPGLRAGIRQHGSLAAAVAAQRRGRPRESRPRKASQPRRAPPSRA